MKNFVKIVKCSKPLYWYNNSIGEIFETFGEINANYYVDPEEEDSRRMILKSDCIPCTEKGEPIEKESLTKESMTTVKSDLQNLVREMEESQKDLKLIGSDLSILDLSILTALKKIIEKITL